MLKIENLKRTIPLFLLLSIAIISHAQTKTDSLQAVFTRLTGALQAADVSLIENDLSDRFTVSISPYSSSRKNLKTLFDSKRMESVELISIELSNNDTTLVKTLFSTTNNKQVESIVAFDKDNKLLFVDYFDKLYGSSRYAVSKQKAALPFVLKNGSIILPLKLNDSDCTLYFLFDSGADGMAIRKTLADSLNLSISHRKTAGVVGGNVQVEISSGNTVHLSDSISLKNQNMAVFEDIGGGLDGIIGLNLAWAYIVNVNFDIQEMSLFTFGDYLSGKEGEAIAIKVPTNLMFLPVSINITGKKEVFGEFIFDTGAHYHAIAFEKFVRKNRLLLSGFKTEEQASTVSLGVSSPVFKGKTNMFRLGKNIEFHNMPITLQASLGKTDQEKDTIDGSIGIELLSQFNFTIDLLQKLVHLVPNKNYK